MWHVSCKYRNYPDKVSVIGGEGQVITERSNITTVLVVYGCCKKLQVGGLKQQNVILSVLWRLEVWNQGVGRAMRPMKALGENLFLSLSAPGGCRHFLVCGQMDLCLHLHSNFHSVCQLYLCFCLIKHLWLHSRPTQVIGDSISILRSLTITSTKTLSPFTVRLTVSRR